MSASIGKTDKINLFFILLYALFLVFFTGTSCLLYSQESNNAKTWFIYVNIIIYSIMLSRFGTALSHPGFESLVSSSNLA